MTLLPRYKCTVAHVCFIHMPFYPRSNIYQFITIAWILMCEENGVEADQTSNKDEHIGMKGS